MENQVIYIYVSFFPQKLKLFLLSVRVCVFFSNNFEMGIQPSLFGYAHLFFGAIRAFNIKFTRELRPRTSK